MSNFIHDFLVGFGAIICYELICRLFDKYNK